MKTIYEELGRRLLVVSGLRGGVVRVLFNGGAHAVRLSAWT